MTVHLIAAGRMEDSANWPKIWHKCYKSWKGCPYKIKIWNDKNIDQLLKEDDEEFFNTLNILSPIYKWDYVRYIILEKFGGAYFDMDVEIVDGSFLNQLNPNKIYLMEGTGGAYVENSIMISKHPYNEFWTRLKNYTKNQVMLSLNQCIDSNKVIYKIGSFSMTEFIFKSLPTYNNKVGGIYEILGTHQFASTTNEIVYTRHHYTSEWNKQINRSFLKK